MQEWNFDVSNSEVRSMRHQLASTIESLFPTRQKRARSPQRGMTVPASVPAPVSVPTTVLQDMPVPALISVDALHVELAESPEQSRAVLKHQSRAPNTNEAGPAARLMIAEAPPPTTTTVSVTTSLMHASAGTMQHNKDAATAALIAGVIEHHHNWSEIAKDPRFSQAAQRGLEWMRQRWRIMIGARQKAAPVPSQVYAFQKVGVQRKYDHFKDNVSAILGRQIE